MKPSCERTSSQSLCGLASSQRWMEGSNLRSGPIFISLVDLSSGKGEKIVASADIRRHKSNIMVQFGPDLRLGVVCLSILFEGGVTVSNNFTKRRQNGFKIWHKRQVRDTFEVGKLYFK